MVDALPTVGASSDVWGALLNQYLQDLRIDVDNSVRKGDLVLNVKDYGLKGDGTPEDLTSLNAAIGNGACSVYWPKPSVEYLMSSPLPDVSNIRHYGDGFDSILSWSSGNGMVPGSASTATDVHFSDLTIQAKAGASHLVELAANPGLSYATFTRVKMSTSLVPGVSIFHGNGFTNLFGIRFRDCQLWRSASATVSAFDLKTTSSGFNSFSVEGGLVHSQGAVGTPFFRFEATGASAYVDGVCLRNITGEQNAGGFFHGYGTNGLLVENVIDYDQTTYADDLFKVSSGVGGLLSYSARIDHSGTAAFATFTSGDHVNIASGLGHFVGRIINGSSADATYSLVGQTMVDHFGGVVQAINTMTTSTTLNRLHRSVLANGASITITLPAANSLPKGRDYIVKNINSSTCTVGSAGGTIDGATTKTLAQWAAIRVITDGTNWYTV